MANRHKDAAGGAAPEPDESNVGGTETSATVETDPETLRAQLEEEKAKADKNLSNWQRAEADLANYRRRAEQERADLARYGNAALLRKVIPVLDDFERAIAAVPAEATSEGWLDGIRLIERKLVSVLEQEGVTTIDALGKEFDPHVHEAVMREDGEGDKDIVVQEFQKGYKLHDRVLRPAMVKVGRGDTEQTEKSK